MQQTDTLNYPNGMFSKVKDKKRDAATRYIRNVW